jgi:hypothetical protein
MWCCCGDERKQLVLVAEAKAPSARLPGLDSFRKQTRTTMDEERHKNTNLSILSLNIKGENEANEIYTVGAFL